MNTKLRNQITLAYLNTLYGVFLPKGKILISPLEDNEKLKEFLNESNIKHWALITPMNPRSETLGDAENQERLKNFESDLKEQGYKIHLSVSELPKDAKQIIGEPMPETGFLIESIFPWDAVKLGYRYGQNAIILGRDDGLAELVWSDHESGTYLQLRT